MIALLLVVTLAQSPNAEAVPATMLIWRTEQTRARAEAALAGFKAASRDWEYFKWEPSWPRTVEIGKVVGLKPGSFVVALGVCFPPEGEPLAGALKVLEPSVTSKPVAAESASVPAPGRGRRSTQVDRPSQQTAATTAILKA